MKKSMVFIASSLALVIGICGCDIGSGSDTVSTLTKEQAAQAVATDDFIYVTTDEVTVPAEMSGKTAYLITYNNSNPSAENIINSNGSNVLFLNDTSSEVNKTKIDRNSLCCEMYPLENRVSRGANIANEPNYDRYNIGDIVYFYVTEDTISEQVPFVKKKIGNYCNVWYYQQENGVTLTDSDFETIASKFDLIFNIEKSFFGSNVPTKFYSNTISYASCNRRINILIYDINQDASPNSTDGTLGYFHSKDFFEREAPNPKTYTVSNSNLTECIYLDSYLLSQESMKSQMYSTLLHEFQHLLYFVNKWLNNDVIVESWNTEMMSMLAEEILQEKINGSSSIHPKDRYTLFKIGAFKGFTNKIWKTEEQSTYRYSNTYAFGSFLLHTYGVNYIKALVHNKGTGIALITESLPNNETFDTVFYKFGKYYIDGLLPAVSYDGINIPEVNLFDQNWTYDKSNIKLCFTDKNGNKLTDEDAENLFEDYNPLIWNKKYYPSLIYPQGFYVQKLGIVDAEGSTYMNLKHSDSNIFRFIYVK